MIADPPLARARRRLRIHELASVPKPAPAAYYLAHRARIIAQSQAWYRDHRAEVLAQRAADYRENPAKLLARVKISQARRRARLQTA